MKHAIVFSAGGAYAAYEVGAAKALLEGRSPGTGNQPLLPDAVTGSSAGAFNASVLLSAPAQEPQAMAAHLESVWLERVASSKDNSGNGVYRIRGDLLQYLRNPGALMREPSGPLMELARDSAFFLTAFFDRLAAVAKEPGAIERRAMEMIDVSALFSVDPLERLIRLTVDLEGIRRSPAALRVVATNWATGEPRVFTNFDVTHDAVRASAAIVGIFPSVEIDGVPYVDGGASMNTPLKVAIDAGADVVHVLALDPELRSIPLPRQSNTLDSLERLLAITRTEQLKTDLRLAAAINNGIVEGSRYRRIAVHLYRPHADIGGIFGMLNFNRERLRAMIESGFREAEAHSCEASGCLL